MTNSPVAAPGDAASGPVPPPASATDLPPSVGDFHYTRYGQRTPTLEPGRIQPRSAADPRHSASGEASLTVGETRRTRREAQGSDSAAPPEPGGAEAEKPGEQ